MKISSRMMGKKMKAMYRQGLKEGQEQGQREVMDISCGSIGRFRAQAANNPITHNAILQAQAHLEGMRLLSYHYDDMSVDEATAFSDRFIAARVIKRVPLHSTLTQAWPEIAEGIPCFSGACHG